MDAETPVAACAAFRVFVGDEKSMFNGTAITACAALRLSRGTKRLRRPYSTFTLMLTGH